MRQYALTGYSPREPHTAQKELFAFKKGRVLIWVKIENAAPPIWEPHTLCRRERDVDAIALACGRREQCLAA